MKFMLRAIAAATAAMAAGSALADIAPPNASSATSGNGGELFFYAFNINTGESYVRDLGVRTTNFLPGGPNAPVDGGTYAFVSTGAPPGAANGPITGGTPAGNVTGPTLGNPYSFSWTDSGLVSFFGQSDFDASVWGVLSHQSGAGQERFLVTSNNIGPGGVPNGQVQGYGSSVDTFVAQVNAVSNGTANNTNTFNDKVTSINPDDAFNATKLGSNIGGLSSFIATAAVGDAAKFYVLNGNAGLGPNVNVATMFGNDTTITARWLLDHNGVLSYSAVSAVPEPGTWAMLVAGLLAVGGVARRRIS